MLGDLLIRQGPLIRVPKDQQSGQGPNGAAPRDFVAKYLGCLGLSPTELDKLPRVLREGNVGGGVAKCMAEVMRSSTWDELFVKINLEAALMETVARREVQQLIGNNQATESLSLYGLYNFIVFINAIRQLLGNEDTKSIALTTLAKATYLLFDLYLELTKRKVMPPSLEAEVWRVRDALADIMEKLFKGDKTITVDGKSFDGNGQLH